MLRSMTGFGAGRAAVRGEEIAVELKSLNHKFCEVKVRLPREIGVLEAAIIKAVKERLARGAVEVLVKRDTPAALSSVPAVDVALAREYHRALSELAKALGLSAEVRLQDVAFQPGVLRVEERGVDLDAALAAATAALGQALDALAAMREVEGRAIQADLEARVARVEEDARAVAKLAPSAVEEYRARIAERIAELSRAGPIDPQRLAQEVAYFAERTDIAEEMTRLSSHLSQFRGLAASPEPAGRKMDFLVQEMHREVNTTGSKSQHPEIAARVVSMKAELERIREQVQNVE